MRLRLCLIGLLVLLMLGGGFAVQAALNLELTQGVNAALPIAIVPFTNQQNNVPGNTTLTAVIKNDLQNSGQFRVIAPGLMSGLMHSKPVTLRNMNQVYWQKKGANDVLIGSVKSSLGGQYQVSFQLVSIYSGGQAKANIKTSVIPAGSVLLNQTFTTSQAGLRNLAHHISNLVYQKLTGVRGIFATKIAYVLVQNQQGSRQYTLYISDADGFNPQPLLVSKMPIMSPAWSPDGQQIAYVSFEHDRAAIYIQDLRTGQRQMVSDYPGINGAPAFSPDGTKLALVLTRTGNPKIYVMNLQTKKLTQITKGYSIDTEPAWSPDGKSLLFTSNRGGKPQIYEYNFNNASVERVTFTGNYNARSSFFPNGQSIVMMHRETGLFGIARQNLQSGQLQALTQSGSDESPSLSPNGKMVVYAMRYGGRGVLAMVSTDGRIKLRLPARAGNVQEPAWSPFLKRIQK